MPINYDQSGVVYDSTVYTWDGEVRTSTVFPIVGVFVAFNDGPYTANPGWQEITPYIRAVSTHRGRSNDLEQFETGTAQLVLDNRDRRFDPFYTSGPYYTKLTPRRQIRIVGQIGGSNYDVFRGYIAGWPVTWSDAGKDSTVTIQCFDALGLMANETVPTDWYGYYINALTPRYWYRCSEAVGNTSITEYSGKTAMTPYYGTTQPYFVAKQTFAGVLSDALFCQYYRALPINTGQGNADFSVTFLVQYQAPTLYASPLGSVTIGYGSTLIDLRYQYASLTNYDVNRLYLDNWQNPAVSVTTTSKLVDYSPSPAQQIHVTINYTAASASTEIYINGQSRLLTGKTGRTEGPTSTTQDYIAAINCAVSEIAVIDRKLTATEITSLYQWATASIVETTTARMNRLIATTDYPTLLTSFTASPAATVAEIGTGANVIPEMQLVADSEGGELYVNKSGILTTTNRTDVFTGTRSAVSQATITDSGAGLKYGTELNIQWDADNLKNDVTVNYSGGGQVEVYNDATIAGYGAASTVIETQLADPTSANQLALMELGVEGSLIPQISPIDLSPNTTAADWQTILGLELLDRVTFKRTPTVGNQFNRDALINAIDHQIAPGVWNTQVTLSMRYTSPLTLDDDILGTLDYNYLG